MDNNEPESRQNRYSNYRQDIENQEYDDSNNHPNQINNQDYQRPERKKKHHYMRWFLLAIVAILLIFGFETVHQINELSDTQRRNDTTLDNIIKNQGKQLAKKNAPKDVRPQIIKIISNTPLSELQRAANNEALFDQLAQKNQVPQQYVQAVRREWFTAGNQTVRKSIEDGDLWSIVNSVKNGGGLDPSTSK